MAQSSYGLRPRERLDYATLHAGKKVQFPAFGFLPARSEDRHSDPYSPVGETSHDHEQHEDPISTDYVKLQQQLETAKAANAVLEHSTKLEQMRHELEGLRAWNAELEKTFAAPKSQEGEAGRPNTLRDLREKSSLTARVDQFLAKLEQSSTDESDGEEKRSPSKSRGRRHSKAGELPHGLLIYSLSPISMSGAYLWIYWMIVSLRRHFHRCCSAPT